MLFSWDERKNRKNQEKHGISFETAIRVFEDPYAVMEWDREIYGEDRWHTIGAIEGIDVLLVVHTNRDSDGEEEIRIISARKANSSERGLWSASH